MGYAYFHSDIHTKYLTYLNLMTHPDFAKSMVLDRFMWCEYAYAQTVSRQIQFTTKQFHNVSMLAFMYKPTVILCTHDPQGDYDQDILPASRWQECLTNYRKFLKYHVIPYTEYDYTSADPYSLDLIHNTDRESINSLDWWISTMEQGYAPTGSPNPQILIVAERLGPNNYHLIPFETGPTGEMMSSLLLALRDDGFPITSIAITNAVKSVLRDGRPVNKQDRDLLHEELIRLKPRCVLFMGAVAAKCSLVTKNMGIPYFNVPHLGAYAHRREDPTEFLQEMIVRELHLMPVVRQEL